MDSVNHVLIDYEEGAFSHTRWIYRFYLFFRPAGDPFVVDEEPQGLRIFATIWRGQLCGKSFRHVDNVQTFTF
jgi:hypothetical protein